MRRVGTEWQKTQKKGREEMKGRRGNEQRNERPEKRERQTEKHGKRKTLRQKKKRTRDDKGGMKVRRSWWGEGHWKREE